MNKIILSILVFVIALNYSFAQSYNCSVSTPNGTTVYMTCYSSEPLSSAQIANINNHVDVNWSSATRYGNASGKYNCHSFAWWWTSSSNYAWMNDPNDNKYWDDGSYSSSNINSGTHISYVYGDHSGRNLVPNSSGWIYSKWGAWPRMVHWYTYSPYNDSYVRFYQ